MLLIFGGFVLTVCVAWMPLRATLRTFGYEEFAQDAEAVRQAGPSTNLLQLRWRNFKHLLGA